MAKGPDRQDVAIKKVDMSRGMAGRQDGLDAPKVMIGGDNYDGYAAGRPGKAVHSAGERFRCDPHRGGSARCDQSIDPKSPPQNPQLGPHGVEFSRVPGVD